MKTKIDENKEELEVLSSNCFDGTSLDLCATCPRKYYYARELKIVPKKEAMPLTYGGAIHEFIEEYYTTGKVSVGLQRFVETCQREGSQIPVKMSQAEAMKCPYSIEYGIHLLQTYAEHFPLEKENESFEQIYSPDGRPFIEVGFNIDLGVGLYYGRIDRIVRQKFDNKLYIWENKHTKNQLNSGYWNKYAVNNQISNYIFASSQILGEEFGGAIINAIRIHPFKKGSKEDIVEKIFQRRITGRSSNQLQDRAKQIQVQIAFIQHARKIGIEAFYQNAPNGCGFGAWRCDYEPLCYTADPKVHDAIIAGGFKEFDWKPYSVVESVQDHFEKSHYLFDLLGTKID